MLIVARDGGPKPVLETSDLRALLDSGKQSPPRANAPSTS
jgi:hypothetical protein